MHTQTSRRCWQPWHARAKWVARAFVRAEQWGLVQSSGFRVITGSLHLSPVSIASEVRGMDLALRIQFDVSGDICVVGLGFRV